MKYTSTLFLCLVLASCVSHDRDSFIKNSITSRVAAFSDKSGQEKIDSVQLLSVDTLSARAYYRLLGEKAEADKTGDQTQYEQAKTFLRAVEDSRAKGIHVSADTSADHIIRTLGPKIEVLNKSIDSLHAAEQQASNSGAFAYLAKVHVYTNSSSALKGSDTSIYIIEKTGKAVRYK